MCTCLDYTAWRPSGNSQAESLISYHTIQSLLKDHKLADMPTLLEENRLEVALVQNSEYISSAGIMAFQG
jgi:hypothetical protein